MADTALPRRPRPADLLRRADRVVVAILALLMVLALADPGQLWPAIRFAATALTGTLPILLGATLALAYVKAAGVEAVIGRAFAGREGGMILTAAAVGAVAPFCSCQVIPFVAALLAMGVPLSAVMAFWLSSPLMDPAMFLFTAGVLGTDFAIAKAVAAVAIGLAGGFAVRALAHTALFARPLKADTAPRGCCGAVRTPFRGAPVWAFWREAPRRATFARTAAENVLFLGKWLTLAYLIEALMLAYVPAGAIAAWLGGAGPAPVVLAALLGVPAYLNGYAAVPLMAGLIGQGMDAGAAMAFVVAGGMTSVPAMLAVWALVRARVFAAYLGFAFAGALAAGFAWGTLA